MEREDIEELRERVSCVQVLARASFALDRRESTRRALKFRRGDDVLIVSHGGRGWWDPLSEASGDVFRLLGRLERLGFPDALARARHLAGLPAIEIDVAPRRQKLGPESSVAERWAARRPLWRGASGWLYLFEDRAIPHAIIAAAAAQGLLRQGPWGSVWMRHGAGDVTGWEERGAAWRGFATGGDKTAFAFGRAGAPRVCVTEAAIDAMSLAALEGARTDTAYVSTGGGWSPTTDAALRALASGRQLVAATDANRQGDAYAARLERLAREEGAAFARRRPAGEDWNEDLRASSGGRSSR